MSDVSLKVNHNGTVKTVYLVDPGSEPNRGKLRIHINGVTYAAYLVEPNASTLNIRVMIGIDVWALTEK